MGVGTISEAELWGIFKSLQAVWQARLRQVVLETDSLTVAQLLENNINDNHPLFSLISSYKNICLRQWFSIIKHVFKDSNRVVDDMASLGKDIPIGIYFFVDPPPQILGLLQEDCTGNILLSS
ncbi:hypothetical protein ACOSP7_028410 [Xanthoceras sorbifolium]